MFHEPLPEPSRNLSAHHARALTDHSTDEADRIITWGGPLVEWRLERLRAALDCDIKNTSTYEEVIMESPEAALLEQEDNTLKADLARALEMEQACVAFLCDADRRAAATLTSVHEAQAKLREAHETASVIERQIEFNAQLGLNATAAGVPNDPFGDLMREMVDAGVRVESQRLYDEIMSAWLDAMHPWQRRLFRRFITRAPFQRAWCALGINPRPEFRRYQGGEWVGTAVWDEWPWYTRLHDANRRRRDAI